MKINQSLDRANQGNQTESTQKSHRAEKKSKFDAIKEASRNEAGESKGPEISGKAREMAHAKQIASSAPEVREDLVADLRQKIASGKYNVSPESVAEKMLQEHMQTRDLG